MLADATTIGYLLAWLLSTVMLPVENNIVHCGKYYW